MRLWLMIGVLLLSLPATAAESARVVFASGDVWISESPVVVGAAVAEGDVIRTGVSGHVYLKTIDGGFFILRPGSVGRIDVYQVDSQEPSNTRIRIQVDVGVVRHISGPAVTHARENFRLNTPVAAIGVRGTDFSVFTTDEVSRVIVHSGGVVVSPFAGSCVASTYGPCEGEFSRELFGAQAGVILQVSRDQTAPQFLQDEKLSPDLMAPPMPGEPSKMEPDGGVSADKQTALDLSPVKTSVIDNVSASPGGSTLRWGRWEVVLGQDKTLSMAEALQTHQLIATNRGFAVLREREGVWRRPSQNSISFALQDGSAVIHDERTGAGALASVQEGSLAVNFANLTFSTSMKLVSGQDSFALRASGVVTNEGRFYSSIPMLSPSNMSVRGALGNDNSDVAYLFQSRLDAARVASGITYWTR